MRRLGGVVAGATCLALEAVEAVEAVGIGGGVGVVGVVGVVGIRGEAAEAITDSAGALSLQGMSISFIIIYNMVIVN